MGPFVTCRPLLGHRNKNFNNMLIQINIWIIMYWVLARHFSYFNSFNPFNNSFRQTPLFPFYRWENKHTEIQWLAQDHTANKWQSWHQDPVIFFPLSRKILQQLPYFSLSFVLFQSLCISASYRVILIIQAPVRFPLVC